MMQNLLRIISWRKVVRAVILVFVIVRLGRHRVPWGMAAYEVGIQGIILLLALRFFLDWVVAAQVAWQARRQGARLRQQCVLLIPPAVKAILLLQWYWLMGFAAWLFRWPTPSEILPGTRYGYMEKGQYGTFFAMMIISMWVDIPVTSLIAGLFTSDPATRQTIHLVLFVASAYLLLLCLGDRFYLQRSSHYFDEQKLALRVGVRFQADIPVQVIAKVQRFEGTWDTWHKQNPNSTVVRPCMLDAPNILLELKELRPAHGVQMTQSQLTTALPALVTLYVDDPAGLLRQIQQASAQLT